MSALSRLRAARAAHTTFPLPSGSASHLAGGGLSAGEGAKGLESVGSCESRSGAEQCSGIQYTMRPGSIPANSAEVAPSAESLSTPSHGAQGDPAPGRDDEPHETAGVQLSSRGRGRPPEIVPTPHEARALLSTYLKTNLTSERGSMTLAARLVAQREDIRPELREAILREHGPARASKHQLPRTVKRAMQAAPALVTYSRNPRNADVMFGHARGVLRRHWAEDRRLRGGEAQSSDDGSINFVVCVPWPWGGCRCSDKFGVKVGRFQWLPTADHASDFLPGFTYAIRASGSYRAEDVCGALGRLWRDTVRPDVAVLERGTWESARVTALCQTAGVEIARSYAPRQKLIEGVFNRLWTILSAMPGQVGRYRGEMERENKLLDQVQAGTLDPRTVFVDVTVAVAALEQAVQFHNRTPIESRQYGKWIPEQRYREDLAAYPRTSLDPALAYLWAPEVSTWTARRGCVGGMVEQPLGVSLPSHWWAPALMDCDGRKVTAHFDPCPPKPSSTDTSGISQTQSALERLQAGMGRTGDEWQRLGSRLRQKFSLPDLGKELLSGFGIGSAFALANKAIESIQTQFQEAARSAKEVSDYVEVLHQRAEAILALRFDAFVDKLAPTAKLKAYNDKLAETNTQMAVLLAKKNELDADLAVASAAPRGVISGSAFDPLKGKYGDGKFMRTVGDDITAQSEANDAKIHGLQEKLIGLQKLADQTSRQIAESQTKAAEAALEAQQRTADASLDEGLKIDQAQQRIRDAWAKSAQAVREIADPQLKYTQQLAQIDALTKTLTADGQPYLSLQDAQIAKARLLAEKNDEAGQAIRRARAAVESYDIALAQLDHNPALSDQEKFRERTRLINEQTEAIKVQVKALNDWMAAHPGMDVGGITAALDQLGKKSADNAGALQPAQTLEQRDQASLRDMGIGAKEDGTPAQIDPTKHYTSAGAGAAGGAAGFMAQIGTAGDAAAAAVNDGLNNALSATSDLLYNLGTGAMTFHQAWNTAIVSIGKSFARMATDMVAKMIWSSTVDRALTALGVTTHVVGETTKTTATTTGFGARMGLKIKEVLSDVYGGAVAAFKALAGIPYVGPVLAVAAMAAALVGGMALVNKIGHAEGGFHNGPGWVSGPGTATSDSINARLFDPNVLEGVLWLRVYALDSWPLDPDAATLLWYGSIAAAPQTGRKFSAECLWLGGILDREVPAVRYGPNCNTWMFSRRCGHLKADFAQAGTLSESDGNTIVVTCSDAAAENFYAPGRIELGGGLAYESRMIVASVAVAGGQRFTLSQPLRQAAADQAITFYQTCDRTKASCKALDPTGWKGRFRGHPNAPQINLSLPQGTASAGGKK